MDDMKKKAVGKQIGGFMQTRIKTRPLHVDTLLTRKDERKPGDVFRAGVEQEEKDTALKNFESNLAALEGPEFQKVSSVDPRLIKSEQEKKAAFRERVEVYGFHGDKLLAGRLPDESIGVYGGGIDMGETPEQAGAREFLEESGYNLKNLKPVEVPPFESLWVERPAVGTASPEAINKWEERAKAYPEGHRTTYLTGVTSGRVKPPSEKAGLLKDVRPIDLATAIAIQESLVPKATSSTDAARLKSRLAVLRTLNKEGSLRRDTVDQKPTHVSPELVESVKIRRVGAMGGKQVFLVDGAKVRNKIDTDFALGGNSARYSYVPQGELWIEETGGRIDKDEIETAKHEAREERKMRAGETYNQAHSEATKIEKQERGNVKTSARKLKADTLQRRLKPGDVLISKDSPSSLLPLTSKVTTPIINIATSVELGRNRHSTIYTGKGTVIDAHPGYGAKEYPLASITGEVRILRPDLATYIKNEAVARARKAVGKPYSGLASLKAWAAIHFDLKGRDRRKPLNAITCSNLIADAYKGKVVPGKHPDVVSPPDFVKSPVMQDLGVVKIATEFAPGIPAGRVIRAIPTVKKEAPNQQWDISASLHPARVRGDHIDLRLVDPQGRAHSWALGKNLPEPGKSTYAIQQATHTKGYALREEPFTIPEGYGATRPGAQVKPLFVDKAEVVEAGPKQVRFLRHHGQETDEFVLRRIGPDDQKPVWALNNATKTRESKEGRVIPDFKPKYQDLAPTQIDFNDGNQVMSAKIDGAHVLLHMLGADKPMRVFSYRPTQRKGGLIDHTYKFPDFQNMTTPPSLKGTILRAEAWASDASGKAIPTQQLGGILNSGVPKAQRELKEKNLKLRLSAIDVVRHDGKDYSDKPFADKLDVLRQVTNKIKNVELPSIATTPEEKANLINSIRSGKQPETREGVVIQQLDKPAPPLRVKFRPEHDVYVREVFKKPAGEARGHAGGFKYSWEPDGPVVGKVGSGFDFKTRQDMLENPEKYVGRVAKVKSQDVYQNRIDSSQLGALRAPSFVNWHLDKTPPELMKEGSVERRKAVKKGR